MAYPQKRSLDYSYLAFTQAQGDYPFPGSNVDVDLANRIGGGVARCTLVIEEIKA